MRAVRACGQADCSAARRADVATDSSVVTDRRVDAMVDGGGRRLRGPAAKRIVRALPDARPAAAAGTGIALIPRFLIETELEDGQLVSPLAISIRGEGAYYFVLAAGRPVSPALSSFWTWLLEEAASFETASRYVE